MEKAGKSVSSREDCGRKGLNAGNSRYLLVALELRQREPRSEVMGIPGGDHSACRGLEPRTFEKQLQTAVALNAPS